MFSRLLLVSISLLFYTHCKAGDLCPNATELLPCTCSQKIKGKEMAKTESKFTTAAPRRKRTISADFNTSEFVNDILVTTVQCLAPKSLEELQDKISNVLYRKWVDKLILSDIPPTNGYNLVELPSHSWMRNVRIRHLEIKNTHLSENFLMALYEQKNCLSWLKVSNCFLSGMLTYSDTGTVETSALHYMIRLQHLDFSSNRLKLIQKSAFGKPGYAPTNLTTLILAKNNIQAIESQAFLFLTKLKHIDLSHNLLKSVSRNYFEPRPIHLQHIDLSWNYISELPVNFFNDMPALRSVNMSHNFLFSLPEKLWSAVWKQLNFIDLSGNFIECNCNMQWLLPMLVSSSRNSTVIGYCLQTSPEQNLEAVKHDLISLTRDKMC